MTAVSAPLLSIRDLRVSFDTDDGEVTVLDNVNLDLVKGQVLGLVGESGCGKSVTSLAVMRLLPRPAGKIVGGDIVFDGTNLLSLSNEQLRKVRGERIAMIFQEPMTALNPVKKIGKQLSEVYELHFPEMGEADVKAATRDMLEKVGIASPEKRLEEYPHQLSGGMRQRVMIAMALACKPDILIADEPTTALDVTIQAQVLELMLRMQRELGMAIILITHDLGVVAQHCDEVAVMYAGRIVEKSSVEQIFAKPMHPYTRGLLNAIPSLDSKPKERLNVIEGVVPALSNLPSGCYFRDRCNHVQASCAETTPDLEVVSDNHQVACIRWRELSA